MKLTLILLLWPVFCSIAFAQIDLGGGLTITDAQLKQIEASLKKTTEDRKFFHWTNKATGMRWIKQSYINSGEVDFYNIPTGDRQVYGPGIYLAETHTSSTSFGEIPVSFTVTKGTPIYDQDVVAKIVGKTLTANQASELGERIPMLRHATSDWYVINHSMHADDLTYGKFNVKEAKVYVRDPDNWSQFKIPGDFKELVQAGDADAVYLKNVLEASDYMDGISFARAMTVNPGQPWAEFEPHNFSKYQESVKVIAEKMPEYQNRGYAGLRQTMLDVQTTFSGRIDVTDLKQVLRTEGIRAGGDEAGKTFLATEAQLKTMQANPYLEVISTPQGKDHLVHYFYPDAFHFKKLKGKISDSLYETLLKQNPNDLMNNHALRADLNRQLIDELVTDFTKRMQQGTANWNELISIHPFEDMNGRSSRMLQEIFDNGQNHFILGDIDILLPVEEQRVYWQRSAKAQQNLQAAFIDEYLSAKVEKRMPDYLKTGALQDYVNNSFPTPMHIELNNFENQELIKNRQWVKLLDKGRAGGLEQLKLNLTHPAKAQTAFQSLIDVTNPDILKFYSTSEKHMLLSMMAPQFKNQQVNTNQVMMLLENYQSIYNNSDAATKAKYASPLRLKNDIFLTIKSKVLDPKISQVDLMHTISSIFNLEQNQTRTLNYFMSLMQKNTPKAANDVLKQYLSMYAFDIQGDLDVFKATTPAEQRRFMVTLKAIVEKFIALGDKDNGVKALEKYRSLYAVADKSVTASLPDAEKLRSWTKKGGFNSCSLMEMLTKLGP